MKKKIVAMILVLACVTGIYAPENAWEAPVTVEASTQKGKKTPSIQKVYNAVKKAYGDDYIPSEKVSKKELKERYGISSKWYSAAIAEVPMISANADTLVIVKAKNAASKKKIRSALKKYREELIQDTCQYPMNQLKIQASKVYVKGNYVCFIMLGTISNKQEEQSEDKKEYGDGTEIHRTRRERLRSPIHRQLLYCLLHIRLSGTPEKFLRGSVLQMRIAG